MPGPPLDAIVERAQQDARCLRDGGADGVVLENFGDSPFLKQDVAPITIACMTRIALAVRQAAPELVLGINVLRNDARAALSIAAAAGAQFVRVNVHIGAMVTDQGVIEGSARETLALRQQLGIDTRIAADVLVKHAAPLGPVRLADVARDTFYRGHADALILTGRGTGQPTSPEDVATVRRAVPGAPLWVGSGLTPSALAAYDIDGAIVGTWLHEDGDLAAPLSLTRVRELRTALDALEPDR